MSIVAGEAIRMELSIVDTAGAPVTSRDLAIRLSKPGDPDDGKYWDTNAGGSWQASPMTKPTSTAELGTKHSYLLDAAATSSKGRCRVSIAAWDGTVVSATMVYFVEEEDPLKISDIPTASAIDTQLSGTHGAGAWTAPTVADIDTELTNNHGSGAWNATISSTVTLAPVGVSGTPHVWEIGEDIPVELFIASPSSGVGLSGQLPYITLTIQRDSDNYYWNGSNWQDGIFTLTSTEGITETDSVNEPGRYRYVLPASANPNAETYNLHGKVDNPPTAQGESYETHVSRSSSAIVVEGEPAQ